MKSFAELTRRDKGIELLRWVCVLPVALVVRHVLHVLMFLVVIRPLLSELSYGGFDRWLRHLTGGLPGGVAFIIAGAKTAPRFRRATAVVLAVGSIVLAVRIHWFPHRDEIPIVAEAVAVACGAAYMFRSKRSFGYRRSQAELGNECNRDRA